MKLLVFVFINWLLFIAFANAQPKLKDDFVIVIHGGAGTIIKGRLSPDDEKAYERDLSEALLRGHKLLKEGGSAMDAIEAAIRFLEDSPLFNAGKGAVLTNEGKAELDAAVMSGADLKAGTVAGITTIKNPISAARLVMDKSLHVMMISKGAEQFAEAEGLEIVDPSYFLTEKAVKLYEQSLKADSIKSTETKKKRAPEAANKILNEEKFGTVGAVALDRYGNLAAGTSTGGMANKKFGRVGDVPIIGAGTYANNATCAISCTGWGEYFIRLVVAKSVSDLIEYKNYSLQKAADEMILKKVPSLGGDGGLIAIDKKGNIAMPFSTAGMFRGYCKTDGKVVVKMYKD